MVKLPSRGSLYANTPSHPCHRKIQGTLPSIIKVAVRDGPSLKLIEDLLDKDICLFNLVLYVPTKGIKTET
jgi:hypothetical protein